MFQRAATIIRERLAARTKVRASLYYASSSILCQALRFCGLIISTKLIDKTQFGFFAQGVLALSFGSLIRDIGQTNALLSYRGDDRRYAVFNFQLNAVLGLAAAALLSIALATVPGIPDELRRIAPLLSLIMFVDILTQTGLVMAQKAFRFGMLARVEIGALILWLGTLAMTVTRIEGYMVLFAAQLAEILFRFGALFITSGWRYVGWTGGADLKRYYFSEFARPLIPQTILQTLAGRLDYLLLSLFSTREELGIYERMLQYIRIPWSLSINLIDRVLLVSYSREQDDPAALRKTLRKSTRLVAGAVVAAACAATLAIAFGLKFFVGSEWAHTILTHWWAAIPFMLVTPFVWNLNIFCQGTGRSRQLLLNTILALVTGSLAGVLLVPRYGAAGMLVAQAVAHFVLLAWQVFVLRRTLSGNFASAGPDRSA